MIPEIGKTIQRGFLRPRLCLLWLACHGESSKRWKGSNWNRPRPHQSLRNIPRPTDWFRKPPDARGYRLRQNLPMSPLLRIPPDLELCRFDAQLLPIAPQPVRKTRQFMRISAVRERCWTAPAQQRLLPVNFGNVAKDCRK
jgi:hypothetical protein